VGGVRGGAGRKDLNAAVMIVGGGWREDYCPDFPTGYLFLGARKHDQD